MPRSLPQVTGHEAAATTILTLTSGGTSPAATTLAFSGTTFSELKLTEGITVLQLIEKFKEVRRCFVNDVLRPLII